MLMNQEIDNDILDELGYEEDAPPEFTETVKRMSRDIKDSISVTSVNQARLLTDSYYMIQGYRKATGNQILALGKAQEPYDTVLFIANQMRTVENQIKSALDIWTSGRSVGMWLKSNIGIGPVISAGLLSNIDPNQANTAGKVWRFAGLDPTCVWLGKVKSEALVSSIVEGRDAITPEHIARCAQAANRNPERFRNMVTLDKEGNPKDRVTRADLVSALAKRPWNNRLKVICYHAGECFKRSSAHPRSFYGPLYQDRKAQEIAYNEAGQFAAQAATVLETRAIGKGTTAYQWYSQGKLPPAHLDARARRWTEKLFLSHVHEAMYYECFNRMPPKPYVMEHLGHVDEIVPQNTDMIPGWTEARRESRSGR